MGGTPLFLGCTAIGKVARHRPGDHADAGRTIRKPAWRVDERTREPERNWTNRNLAEQQWGAPAIHCCQYASPMARSNDVVTPRRRFFTERCEKLPAGQGKSNEAIASSKRDVSKAHRNGWELAQDYESSRLPLAARPYLSRGTKESSESVVRIPNRRSNDINAPHK